MSGCKVESWIASIPWYPALVSRGCDDSICVWYDLVSHILHIPPHPWSLSPRSLCLNVRLSDENNACVCNDSSPLRGSYLGPVATLCVPVTAYLWSSSCSSSGERSCCRVFVFSLERDPMLADFRIQTHRLLYNHRKRDIRDGRHSISHVSLFFCSFIT